MRITEADCSYVSCNDSNNTCELLINVALWTKRPRVMEIPKRIRKFGKAYKVTKFDISTTLIAFHTKWPDKVIVRYPRGVTYSHITLDNYETEEYD